MYILITFQDFLINLNATLATDQKWSLSRLFSTVSFTIPFISTMVNGTMLNFGKRYKDSFRVIFDQWPKLHLDLDALSNQRILKGV